MNHSDPTFSIVIQRNIIDALWKYNSDRRELIFLSVVSRYWFEYFKYLYNINSRYVVTDTRHLLSIRKHIENPYCLFKSINHLSSDRVHLKDLITGELLIEEDVNNKNNSNNNDLRLINGTLDDNDLYYTKLLSQLKSLDLILRKQLTTLNINKSFTNFIRLVCNNNNIDDQSNNSINNNSSNSTYSLESLFFDVRDTSQWQSFSMTHTLEANHLRSLETIFSCIIPITNRLKHLTIHGNSYLNIVHSPAIINFIRVHRELESIDFKFTMNLDFYIELLNVLPPNLKSLVINHYWSLHNNTRKNQEKQLDQFKKLKNLEYLALTEYDSDIIVDFLKEMPIRVWKHAISVYPYILDVLPLINSSNNQDSSRFLKELSLSISNKFNSQPIVITLPRYLESLYIYIRYGSELRTVPISIVQPLDHLTILEVYGHFKMAWQSIIECAAQSSTLRKLVVQNQRIDDDDTRFGSELPLKDNDIEILFSSIESNCNNQMESITLDYLLSNPFRFQSFSDHPNLRYLLEFKCYISPHLNIKLNKLKSIY